LAVATAVLAASAQRVVAVADTPRLKPAVADATPGFVTTSWAPVAAADAGAQAAQRASPFPEGDAQGCQGSPGFLPYREEGIDTILKFAGVTAEDVVFDIGLNSGEVALSAARRLGARGVVLPFCRNAYDAALDSGKRAGLSSRVSVRTGHFMDLDYRDATVIVLTMIPMHNERLFQKLARELRPGARVVSSFGAGDAACPDRSLFDLATIAWKALHVWTVPLDCSVPAVRRPARRPEEVREPLPIRQPLIDELGRVEERLPAPAEGIVVADDGMLQLDIMSGRVEAIIEALGPPPYEQFEDYVHIRCGSETKGRAFECVSLWVGVDGFEIPAYSQYSSVVPYKTSMGKPAERRRVNALFNAAALRWGFTVRYMSPDGTERVREVSEAEAANNLLVHVVAPSPAGPK
jgi:SAM-dependent methyltransferase